MNCWGVRWPYGSTAASPVSIAANITRKSYGEGYCYPCFKTLARCDLCVVSPDRCHYAAGTCREPRVGRELLYAAAPRVSRELGRARRWASPRRRTCRCVGSTRARRRRSSIMRTQSRIQAGCVEAALARHVSDRTDWRSLVGRDAQQIDLVDAVRAQRGAAAHANSPQLDAAFSRRACVGRTTDAGAVRISRHELRRVRRSASRSSRASPSAERCSASRAST